MHIFAEKDGKLHEGIIDMPANFLPDAMAPIIRFMYTGIPTFPNDVNSSEDFESVSNLNLFTPQTSEFFHIHMYILLLYSL